MYSFEEIMNRCLDRVDDKLDKRQGSIIYDALAPVCVELANMFMVVEIFKDQTYVNTATDENLDNWGSNISLPRYDATKSIRIAEFYNSENIKVNLPLNTRFVSADENATPFILIDSENSLLQCEESGSIGNDYFGNILPLNYTKNLKSAKIVGTHTPAENVEDDNTYRNRIIQHLSYTAYGGNVADYIEFVNAIDGVGSCKVFPVWNGGGTVKVSIVDTEFNSVTDEFIENVQTIIDPITNSGEGYGIAPIGHSVTVTTPTLEDINIELTISPKTDFTISSLIPFIEEELQNYIDEVKAQWVTDDILYIRTSYINYRIMHIEGVFNVENILINGVNSDYELTQDSLNQKLPKLNEVVVNG